MAIPGLFIEYLIVGVLALIWIYPLLPAPWVSKVQAAHLPLLALGLYVVGMVIDFFAWLLTGYIKHGLRAWAERGHLYNRKELGKILTGGIKRGSITSRQIYLAMYAPEVAKEAAMRSSRDRIARGAIINSVLFTIFASSSARYIGVIAILVSFSMWVNFELSSYSYVMRAEELVKEKLSREDQTKQRHQLKLRKTPSRTS